MKIDRLHLLAYGHHREAELDLSRPGSGLTVVCGPNEAGKSTAMRALLAALYGFPRTIQDAYVHGRHGLRLGAEVVAADGRRLGYVRQSLARSALIGSDGQPLDERDLMSFLGGVDRQLYVRMFSVDHDELRTRSDDLLDSEGEIGRLVFGASLGSGSVTRVLQRLDERADKLYKERGSAQLVTAALKRHRDAMKGARDLRVRSRDWDRRLQAVADAKAKVAIVGGELEGMRVQRNRLSWVHSALPLIAQRSESELQHRSLEEEGIVPSSDWATRASGALGRAQSARKEHRTATAAHEALEARIAAISIRSDLIERSGQIDKLVQGVGRYQKDAGDLEQRRGQLEEARKALAVIIAQLGLETDDGRLVAESELVAVEELGQKYSALQTSLAAAESEHSKLNRAIETAARELEEHPEPKDVAALARALAIAKPVVSREEALPAEDQKLQGLRKDARTGAGRLGLGALDLEEVQSLQIPTARQIADEQARRKEVGTKREQLEEREAGLIDRRDDLDAQIALLAAKPGVPDPDRLPSAREHRDAGWSLIRQMLSIGSVDEVIARKWAKQVPLPDAYEAAVGEADGAADDRYEHAEDLTSIVQLRSARQAVTDELQGIAESRVRLEGEASGGDETWRQLWLAVGVTASDPSEMAGWREGYQQLALLVSEIDRVERLLISEQDTISTHVESVRAAIAGLGLVPDASMLRQLVAQAEEITADALTQGEARRAAATALKRATSSLPERTQAVADEKDALETWETSWLAALEPLRLESEVRPAAALAAVRAYRALPGARQEVRGFESRIEGIERDLDNFSRQVSEVASGLTDLASDDPLDIVENLRSELASARLAASARDTLDSQLTDAGDALRASSLELAGAEEELVMLRAEVSLGTDSELSPTIDRARLAAELISKVSQIEANLIAQGGGRSLEAVVTAVSEVDMDADELVAAIATLDDEIAARDGALAEANQFLGEATRDLDEVTSAGTAADLEQDAQAELALAAEFAAEFAQTKVAAEVLRKVVSDYGEQHRGPMLSRASEIFARVTDGAFVDLVPEALGEKQILLAKRRNGELLATTALSDGTRDELYFSLRIAGIEYELDHLEEPLPVLFDDVLVNFDDPRSSEALCVLAELGEKTQVVLFTHHEGVVTSAQTALSADRLGVVRLEPRDHSLQVVTGLDSGEGSIAGASGRNDGDESSPQAVLEVLRTSGQALPKADLLAASGIDATRWPAVIRSLVDSGQVVQEGVKKGAKYRLP